MKLRDTSERLTDGSRNSGRGEPPCHRSVAKQTAPLAGKTRGANRRRRGLLERSVATRKEWYEQLDESKETNGSVELLISII